MAQFLHSGGGPSPTEAVHIILKELGKQNLGTLSKTSSFRPPSTHPFHFFHLLEMDPAQ